MRSIGDAIWSVEVTATTVISDDCVSVNAGGEVAAAASMVVGVVSVAVVPVTVAANFLAAEKANLRSWAPLTKISQWQIVAMEIRPQAQQST